MPRSSNWDYKGRYHALSVEFVSKKYPSILIWKLCKAIFPFIFNSYRWNRSMKIVNDYLLVLVNLYIWNYIYLYYNCDGAFFFRMLFIYLYNTYGDSYCGGTVPMWQIGVSQIRLFLQDIFNSHLSQYHLYYFIGVYVAHWSPNLY